MRAIDDYLTSDGGKFTIGLGIILLFGFMWISVDYGVDYYEQKDRNEVTRACLAKPNTTPVDCGITPKVIVKEVHTKETIRETEQK